MNAQHPQDRDEEFGDGYSNEYQRALAWSQMERPLKNERAKAREWAAKGKFVVLETYPVHCRITDAVMGEEAVIRVIADDYETAVGRAMNSCPDPECGFEVIGPAEVAPVGRQEAPADEADQVPF